MWSLLSDALGVLLEFVTDWFLRIIKGDD